MFKFKHKTFAAYHHETLCYFSISSALSMVEPATQLQQPSNLNTLIEEPSKSPLPHIYDPQYYLFALQNCPNLSHIRKIHAQVSVNGLLKDLDVTNKLLFTYRQHKLLSDAYSLFGLMSERDSFSWSVMIGGFCKSNDFRNCFCTFREYMRSGQQLDNYTLPFVIRACRDALDLRMGRLVHGIVYKFGLDFDCFVSATLVDMYAKNLVIDDAKKVFDRMPTKDLVTWTVMIGGYSDCGNADKAVGLFDQMRDEGIVPDKVCMVNVVTGCAKLGAMYKATFVHDYIWRKNFSLDVILGTAMIDMHAKCGSVDSAREIFDLMKDKNVVSWSAMIAAYGYHGRGQEALEVFNGMLRNGLVPNRITFVSLLYACSHSGLVEDGLRFFSLMHEEYCLIPDVKHYTCMVDLLGRAGRFGEALNMIESMTVEKDEGLWAALLGACRIYSHVELAEMAAKSLLELQPQNPAYYVLLSNIYAKASRWEDVAKVREMMTHRRLKKIPGWTWIEVENKIHQFSVGDHTHPQSKEIYDKLKNLLEELELSGYVPDMNFVLHDVDEEVKIVNLSTHSEKLAIAYGLIGTTEGTPIRITKNLRVCGDCHTFTKYVSLITNRAIIVRDVNRFHHFKEGACSCRDYW